jgi:hypothetical protein
MNIIMPRVINRLTTRHIKLTRQTMDSTRIQWKVSWISSLNRFIHIQCTHTYTLICIYT